MKKGFVASCFDLGPHLGHLMMLRECIDNCHKLIVALHVDPSSERSTKRKPIPTLSERFLQLRTIQSELEIIPYETERELYQLLKIVKPDVRFLGDDYRDKAYTGDDLGIPVHFIDRSHGLSSSRLREMARG